MAIFKRCNTCHEIYQGKSCPRCAARRARNNQRKEIDNNSNLRIYHSRLWRKCRRNVLIRDMGYDIWLLGVGQVYRCRHPVVHHIVERDEAPELIYDIDNLITVTRESHEEIHRLYLIAKDDALARIRKGKEEFTRRFGDEH